MIDGRQVEFAAEALSWDEEHRSSTLHSLGILDTPREQAFDDIAKLASSICETPIALVNFIDTSRQFFKAQVGLGLRTAPLEDPLSRDSILENDILIVPDASRDLRINRCPFVTDAPLIRSYAGALIRAENGLPIGVVCVLDYKTRGFSAQQIDMLSFLARQVTAHLQLRTAIAPIRQPAGQAPSVTLQEAMFGRLVRQAPHCIAMADKRGRIVFLNDAAYEMVGLDPSLPLPNNVMEYISKEDHAVFTSEIKPLILGGSSCERELKLRHFRTGDSVPALFDIFPVKDDEGLVVGFGVVTKDLTDQKIEEARRTEMMSEAAHRIKNTLSIVQAIVSQSLKTAETLQSAKSVISKRVAALAKAQDILTATESVNADICEVVSCALASHDAGHGRLSYTGPSKSLAPRQALGLSLALHELATNAAKYGSLSGEEGCVEIVWNVKDDGAFNFTWTERGGPPVTKPTRSGYGSQMIQRMVSPYFDGSAKLEYRPEGLRFSISGRID